ncbi:MAG: FAD-dependent oxidoreductase [Desulfurococcales archaeon]|nr:FAD-dependent oxidoreductase [Desulfurococcales archaeon]
MAEGCNVKFIRCKEEPAPTGKSVGIVGAGPAGLAAAGFLRCAGHHVVVYDMMPEAGGMMFFGIPEDRIKKDNIRRSVRELMDFGVRFVFNIVIGKDIPLEALIATHDAVLIATGTWKSSRMNIPGEDLPRVIPAAEWLVDVHLAYHGYKPWSEVAPISGNVLVIGGGLTAADAVTVPLTYPQFRDKVNMIVLSYRRTRKLAPMREAEMNRLEKLGAQIWELTQPVEFKMQGEKVIVKFVRLSLIEAGAGKRPKPVPLPGSEYEKAFDWVLKAVGVTPTPPFDSNKYGIELNDDGTIKVDENFMTTRPGVFAAGDVKHGPSLIGPAFKSGLDVAKKINDYLFGRLKPKTEEARTSKEMLQQRL